MNLLETKILNDNKYKHNTAKNTSKHFPVSTREWNNSVYVYNKNALNLIPIASLSATKLIKAYFSLFSSKLEKILRKKKLKLKSRKLSSNRIFIGNSEFKHTNNKILIHLYLFNRQAKSHNLIFREKKLRKKNKINFKKQLLKKIGKLNIKSKRKLKSKENYYEMFMPFFYKKTKDEKKLVKVERLLKKNKKFQKKSKKLLIRNKILLRERKMLLKIVKMQLKKNRFTYNWNYGKVFYKQDAKWYLKVLHYIDKTKNKLKEELKTHTPAEYWFWEWKDELKLENISRTLKQIIILEKHVKKSVYPILERLKVVRLKDKEGRTLKENLKENPKNSLQVKRKKLKSNLYVKNIARYILYSYYKKLENVNKYKLDNIFLRYLKKYLQDLFNKNVELEITMLKRFYLDSNILFESLKLKLTKNRRRIFRYLNKLERKVKVIKKSTRLFLTKMSAKNNNSMYVTKDFFHIKKQLKKSLKYRHVTGFRIEAKGRLTRRHTASRSVTRVKYKGNLYNIDSSKRGLSTVLLKGNLQSNLQYSKLKSKTRIGSFGLKGWVNGN